MPETFSATLHVIERHEVPAGSFRYGQLAADESFDVRPDFYAVCTPCSKANEHYGDQGYDGSWFDVVLVAHFLYTDWDDAARTARTLVGGGQSVTIVNPA